jgi:ABC-type transport system involved in cytochrome bd biosynthesis fused ATPase/permease subunit
LKYRSGTYEDREDFRTKKQNAKHNKRMLKRAMRYAGSDQQSIADHQFYNNLGERMALIGASIPAAYLATGAVAAAAYTAPT